MAEKKGGFNHAFAGVFKNVQFFDFRSYYPSLFLSLNIFKKHLYFFNDFVFKLIFIFLFSP